MLFHISVPFFVIFRRYYIFCTKTALVTFFIFHLFIFFFHILLPLSALLLRFIFYLHLYPILYIFRLYFLLTL